MTRSVAFWAVLLPMLLLSTLVTINIPHEPMPVLLATVFWSLTVLLIMSGWRARGRETFGRIATGVGLAILFVVTERWFTNPAALAIPSGGCPPRAGPFWPLVLIAAIGCLLSIFAFRYSSRSLQSVSGRILRAILFWGVLLAWLSEYVKVFSIGMTWEESKRSLSAFGKMTLVVGLAAAALALVMRVLNRRHRAERKEVAADLARLGVAGKRAILDAIDRYSREREFQLCYIPVGVTGSADPGSTAEHSLTAARSGGNPAALPGEPWPRTTAGQPAIFLLQLRLLATPRLPNQWHGRLLSIFLLDHGLHIRCYAPETYDNLTELPNPLPDDHRVPQQSLQPTAVPYFPRIWDEEAEEFSATDLAQFLLTNAPGVRELLEPSSTPVALLKAALTAQPQWPENLSENLIQVAGDPIYIQAEHEPRCTQCEQPMRFLLQFPDITPDGLLLGDCGSGYVYGCDTHPDHCVGFVDCY